MDGETDDVDVDASATTTAGITRLRWHASLPYVICSYTDGVVCVWDARSGNMIRAFVGHGDMINDMSVAFVGGVVDGGGGATTVIVTGSDDRTVKVFEFQS